MTAVSSSASVLAAEQSPPHCLHLLQYLSVTPYYEAELALRLRLPFAFAPAGERANAALLACAFCPIK